MADFPSETRIGWCPGVLRPMEAGDGWLARVKPRGNRLTLDQARGVARVARRFGSGVLTLTSRANIQIRGLAEATFPRAVDALAALGLLDADAAGEAVRNVVASPLAGGADATFDIRAAVAALEDALVRDAVFRRLPAKFAWTIDDGGPIDLSSVLCDVRFTAVAAPGGAGFAIELPGAGPTARCGAEGVVVAASAIAASFLALCRDHDLAPHRLRDLVAVTGTEPVFRHAGLPLAGAAPARPPLSTIGLVTRDTVGVAPAFGRLEAEHLLAFCEAVARAGARDLRITPWRGLLATALADSGTVLAAAARAGFIVDPADPRLAIVACAGQPACRRAGAPVQADAAALAPRLGRAQGTGVLLHLSGCAKGCAHAGRAPLTAVARDGLYDIVRGGRAGDVAETTGLPLAALAALLASPTARVDRGVPVAPFDLAAPVALGETV